jgi:peptidoglycan/LPS O-acetylase OafA/YrhL
VSVRAPGVQRPAQHAVHGPRAGYRGDIDGLRAVAVTLVVLFHVGLSVVSGGFVGVDVFYVISGFLITGLLVRELRSSGTISITNFYARRVRRLLPLSALVLVTTAVASRFLAPVLDRPGIGSDIQAAAMYVANWHYATASTQYMASTGKSPVLHYWSLSVEEQFYVLWPLLLLLASTGAARRSWQVGFRRIVVTLGTLGAASFALSVVTTTASGPFAFFGLHTRAWEMAVGAGLSLATDRWLRRPALWSIPLGWIGLLMILASAGLLTGDTPYPGSAAALPVLGTAMLLASGAAQSSWSVGRLLSLPPVRYLGRISYAWYLWHWPCLVLLGGVGADSAEGAGDQSVGGAGVARLVAAIAASLALSVLSHHLVENPARRTAWLSRFTGRSLMLGVGLTGVSVLASFVLLPTFATTEGSSSDGLSVAAAVQARTDDADVPHGCYQSLYTTSTPHDCQFGDPDGDRTIVLLGDSNAGHWFSAYRALALDRGWKFYFWGKSGCPTVDALMWLGPTRSAYDTCTQWRAGVRDELRRLGHVDIVVLARSRGTGRYLMTDSTHRAQSGTRRPLWRSAASRTLGSLNQVSSHLVLMRPVPTPPFDVPACIAEGPSTARARCSFPRRQATRPGPLDRAENDLVRTLPRTSFLNLNRRICPSDPCPPATPGGQIIYLNRWHLTVTYSTSQWPVLARRLGRLVGE